MIKHKTVSKFLLQPSFDIFMQDSFNIDYFYQLEISHKDHSAWKLLKISDFQSKYVTHAETVY